MLNRTKNKSARLELSNKSTGRVTMNKPVTQNINSELHNLLVAPKGSKLIHCDSGQVLR